MIGQLMALALQVGLERFEFFPHFRLLVGVRLIDRQLGRHRRFLERIGLGARFFRRDIDGDDILAALEQRFEHRLAERLLAVNDDTHCQKPLQISSPLPACGESVGVLRTPFLVPRTPMRSIGYVSEANEGEGASPRF
jgi:hypothetical protein